MPTPLSILWFRQDLRLADQPALAAAIAQGAVLPVYILDDDTPGEWRIGGAQRWWLHHSLASLAAELERASSRLILRRGKAVDQLQKLCEDTGATSVHALRHYEPWWLRAETEISSRIELRLHDGNHLAPPRDVLSGSGQPFKIYTPYWRALQQHLPPARAEPAPTRIEAPASWPESDRLEEWALLPSRPNWASEFGSLWQPGEEQAGKQLDALSGLVGNYLETRNLPSQDGTSRLSPHLHFGEISPTTVYRQAVEVGGAEGEKFVKELAWRDFTQSQMMAHPDIGERHGRSVFNRFPWRRAEEAADDFRAWTNGRTGYPIVDAGMRQLWRVGWVHNRVRMMVASFLVKHLLIDWRDGARWFWDTLVDADYGNNSVNWQWIAGSGFDSNQFTRIMAPLTQSARFDAAGYIRQWVPELGSLRDEEIHDPDAADARPSAYPPKMIGHKQARERALTAYRTIRA